VVGRQKGKLRVYSNPKEREEKKGEKIRGVYDEPEYRQVPEREVVIDSQGEKER